MVSNRGTTLRRETSVPTSISPTSLASTRMAIKSAALCVMETIHVLTDSWPRRSCASRTSRIVASTSSVSALGVSEGEPSVRRSRSSSASRSIRSLSGQSTNGVSDESTASISSPTAVIVTPESCRMSISANVRPNMRAVDIRRLSRPSAAFFPRFSISDFCMINRSAMSSCADE